MKAEHETLLQMSVDCERQQQIHAAIQCLHAVLGNDPLPDVQFVAGLRLARMYIKYTSNFKEAQGVLHQLVRAPARGRPA
jgi:Cohesin loading factor